MSSTILIAASVLVTSSCGVSAMAADPFRAAALAPPDVRLFVHIDGAASLRTQLQDRPIASWLGAWLAEGELPGAWHRLSQAVGMDDAALFDACLGRELTVLSRPGASRAEWVVLTGMEPSRSAALLGKLSPVVLAPRGNVSVFHLVGQGLLLARAEGQVLIAPDDHQELFQAVLANLAALPAHSLAQHEGIKQGMDLGPGRVGVFVRHELPLGGWSVGVADLRDDTVSLRHASRFSNAPFRSRITELSWNPAPLRWLEGTGFLGVIEPTDTAGGPFDAFVATLLGEPLITSALGANLGPRRITLVSDVEGRVEVPPFDLLLPTILRAYEVNDAELARTQLDRNMLRLLAALNRLGEGNFHLEVPDPDDLDPRGARSVPIGPMARWLFGDVPGIDRVSLNWTVVESATGDGGRWCVLASHPGHLDAVAEALRASPRVDVLLEHSAKPGRWTNCGVADGKRLAQHLAGWSAHAEALAAPQDVQAMRETLNLLRELAQGVDRCDWQLSRPSADSVRTEAEILLSPPDSAGTVE